MKSLKLTPNLLKTMIKRTLSEDINTNEDISDVWSMLVQKVTGKIHSPEQPWHGQKTKADVLVRDKDGNLIWVAPDKAEQYEPLSLGESDRMLGKTGAFRVREPRSIGRPAQAAQWAPRVKTPPTPRVEDAELAQSWKDANPGGTWGVSSGAPSVDPQPDASEEDKREMVSLLSSDRTSPSQKKDLARRIEIHGPTSRALAVFLRDNPDIYPA